MTETHQSPHYQLQHKKSFNSDKSRVSPPFEAGMEQWGALVSLCALTATQTCSPHQGQLISKAAMRK